MRNFWKTYCKYGVLIGVVLLVIAGIFISQTKNRIGQQLSVDEIRKSVQEGLSKEEMQKNFLSRIDKREVGAFEKYKTWLSDQKIKFQEFSLDEATKIFFVPGSTIYSPTLSSALIFTSADGIKSIDVPDVNDQIGVTTSGLFVFRTVKDFSNECSNDQSVYVVDRSGTVIKLIQNRKCWEDWSLVFFGMPDNRGLLITIKEQSDGNVALGFPSGRVLTVPKRFLDDMLSDASVFRYASGPERDTFVFTTDLLEDNDHRTTTSTIRLTSNEFYFDERTRQILECRSGWKSYIAAIEKGDPKTVENIENCVIALNYPFKKFTVPGSKSYVGFMGNYWRQDNKDRVVCTFDAFPNGCILYKVANEKVSVLSKLGEENESSLILSEPIELLPSGDVIIHHFPYEICVFDSYEAYNFERATTTARIVDFVAAGCGGDETVLSFYPGGRKIDIKIETEKEYRAGEKTLSTFTLRFNENLIGTADFPNTGSMENPFPGDENLYEYATQADKTKFYFSSKVQNYLLDLAPAIPRLIKR